ncbi:nucleotidyltransferase family protein [Aquimarina brevivitae]|uniref:Molybdenum cofactor cytidylyltransferase n=1 Tax=Aquimarina brevivitae TaxID=323412 RepID=A0A4Q7NV02_9FLAO|nr:nucleotidyltransferase family protein [Aquimarina brevivitae]RZS90688.1 molybdenum cofactor cytidylyltransferase [Aquimarina brevivitae]
MLAHLILAAGSSSRLGREKQLLPYAGVSLIEFVVKESLQLTDTETFVVLGYNRAVIANQILDYDIHIITNANWQKGMGSSICCGVDFINQKKTAYEGVLISLVDQPLLDHKYLNHLIELYIQNDRDMVATRYPETLGVPAIFSKNYFEQLLKLKGAGGAKKLLNTNKIIPSLDPGSLFFDIDTEEDYENLMTSKGLSKK